MIDKVNSLQMHDREENSTALDEIVMSLSYHELTHSLTSIKNNIRECIHNIESATQIKPPLIHSMRSAMKDIERAAEAIHKMNNFILNKPVVR